ncbi:protein FANTASTIC FOUR 1 [Brachypodium distachyon]|uniref:FAF domain-containing protein n=1 Tax=Brachypodium distachyon TaxID=15368 RepID=I1HJV4_BRADI|nr:protein FANTASTIC FOUR 1 [Brachypodium distachyon]KQK06493.1 hypothetical protein BRADI_2g26640v3 [Brachypodium distachyon]|eukprot:XP_010231449.1 protein FANTASTIC FOUR 1 [Brachypodium distachyon]
MTNSTLYSPPQIPAAGPWSSLYAPQEQPAKPRDASAVAVLPSSSPKKPAYGVKRNLEMCTEALGCETGGFDAAGDEEADEGAERKRRARREETKVEATRVRRRVLPLPPPLTTLAAGVARTRMVHERRDGRLEVYAVRAAGMEAQRSGGRLQLRFRPCHGCNIGAARSIQRETEDQAEEEAEEVDQQREQEEEYGVVAKYVRGGRCAEMAEGAATAARRGEKWEPEQAAAFWVAIT